MSLKNVALAVALIAIIIAAVRITPLDVVQLLVAYPIPQYIPFTKTVNITLSPSGQVHTNRNITGYVLLQAPGSISAVNPITVSVAIYSVGSGTTLAQIMGLRWVVVDFFDSFAYPFTTFPCCPQENRWGEINMTTNPEALHWTSYQQTKIIYLLSGIYNVTLIFYGTRPFFDNNAEVDLTNVITIAPEQATFTYVTELSLLSLELIIVALMLVEIFKSEEKKDREKYDKRNESEIDKSLALPIAAVGLAIIGLYYIFAHNRKKSKDQDE